MRKIRDTETRSVKRDSRRKDKAETLRRKQIRANKSAQPVAA
ncbi:hypothetical protein SEA_MANEEKUL_69 [Streptomyces phage Maneekul]|uniref:Uncharacterized protein n=2 Tax=Likavirus TaxID=1982880 RepID=A0A514U4B8_9CAUD|nr:hypothetical protein KGG98_gp69 [Streptomyces phage Yasdnil]YP_010056549.1 hypothetical protein KGG99_gp69 [Streptomyces phage Werner]AWN07437.1 hypothetical protein SEA_MANEEKUL_69 [Streptomyces phage Maneekul]QAY17750.1 hypothetical protein SEA_ASTEN_69 [Streptomyces phage Asten]QDK03238.1 hypothetical protein SEA_TUANPN_67 [Streptomyces phage TuanPN]QFP95236.1 hypothetical protein SEA_WHATEVER_69 [Streptomyces phage Whatever]QQO39684.1 hypothetical protein SEA_HIPPO_69 [Streptomyces pha